MATVNLPAAYATPGARAICRETRTYGGMDAAGVPALQLLKCTPGYRAHRAPTTVEVTFRKSYRPDDHDAVCVITVVVPTTKKRGLSRFLRSAVCNASGCTAIGFVCPAQVTSAALRRAAGTVVRAAAWRIE